MGAIARLRYCRIAPRKVRIVADMIRGRSVEDAVNLLSFTPKVAAPVLRKIVLSAVANAEVAGKLNTDNLIVKTVMVDQGPSMRRWRPRAQGRAYRINRKTSHITVELDVE